MSKVFFWNISDGCRKNIVFKSQAYILYIETIWSTLKLTVNTNLSSVGTIAKVSNEAYHFPFKKNG